ncbi:TetR/AcrR family transcriptional regulator [Novosphingobium sp.]|uniref:TetR/AcrR family transcriptional regulator n=1 Tax=Novosphingobium sp. TaxID=1874826 RepID=UPI0025CCDFB6|nr:TetR/AcrR family transcriptional regulator [Novosphingobium sp.]
MTALASPATSRPRAGRPTAAQADARHMELLDTALTLFLEHGYEQTTVEGIAAATGMTKRTLYARYPEKSALFRAAVSRAIDRSVTARATLESLDEGDLEATLIAIARARVAHAMTPEGLRLQRIINAESYRFPEIFTWSFERATRPVTDHLEAVFQRATARGALALDDPAIAARVFLSMVVSGPVRIIVSGNALDEAEISARITFAVRLFLNGARPRKDTP